jgi:hypothetical protein
VKDMALGAFVKPENALGPKHRLGQQVVEKVLKLANGKGAIAGKGQRREPIDGQGGQSGDIRGRGPRGQ